MRCEVTEGDHTDGTTVIERHMMAFSFLRQ